MLINWLVGMIGLLVIFLTAYTITGLAERMRTQPRITKILTFALFAAFFTVVPHQFGKSLLERLHDATTTSTVTSTL